jgi:CheY-like chemotaxis protein
MSPWHSRICQRSIVQQQKGFVPRLKFLVVDDDEDGRYLTRHRLQRRFPGCDIVETSTTDEAVAVASGDRIDAVVTDHHLGLPDGTTLIQKLRALQVTCPVVMVTNSSDPKVRTCALAAGATQVFAPGDMDFTVYLKFVLEPGLGVSVRGGALLIRRSRHTSELGFGGVIGNDDDSDQDSGKGDRSCHTCDVVRYEGCQRAGVRAPRSS